MTRDDIIRMAKEAAAKHGHTFKDAPNDAVLEIIGEAYAMGAAAERKTLHEVNAELLAALKACLQCFDEMHGRKPAFVEDSISMSKEAIDKATGETE